jgi:hypothetical protein
MSVHLTKHYWIVQIGEKKIGGECGTNGRKTCIGIW